MTQQRLVPFDAVGEPEPGMLYSDRLGPWFDLDGSEIIPVGSEAVEVAVEQIIGTFQLQSNLPEIDGTSVAIDFPLLTQLIQEDWDRVIGGEDGRLPGRGFLIAYQSSAAAVGRLAEDLLCQVVLGRLLAAYWPEGRVLAVQDAVHSGQLVAPPSGERCDDLVIVDRSGLILVESKGTIGGWVASAPDGTQGHPAAHQECPRRSEGHDRCPAGKLAQGPSRGSVVSERGRATCWPGRGHRGCIPHTDQHPSLQQGGERLDGYCCCSIQPLRTSAAETSWDGLKSLSTSTAEEAAAIRAVPYAPVVARSRAASAPRRRNLASRSTASGDKPTFHGRNRRCRDWNSNAC